ncbi:MAG TPA: serine/threonine-protein kinase, partial [Myxococcota bacterium]|nr:serine/threonine-protein kinase [Myxococcota bacterium]
MGAATSKNGVGPYRFEAELGRGASGIVYRALDPSGREVAVKVLHAHLGDEELRERFRREAEVGIDHPNVVKVLAAGVGDDDVAYIAFERLIGESLEDRLRRGPLTARELVELGRQACAGLAAAHERGIVHRDVKPANLFLTADGQVKLLDFGVALATSRNTRVTQAATIMGTPAYLSPEQTRALGDLDPRTDLWSLGAILYEAASGKMAFGRDTMFAT